MTNDGSHLADAFAAAMHHLGPFEPAPALAAAVSGGADSLALAILARNWACQRGGSLLALVVDHGLRPESAEEARLTLDRLTCLGIPARLLTLTTLLHGPALAKRARDTRYQVLTDACRMTGRLHLLLGHHAGDQAETLAMRVLRGSQTHGLAGMAALRETMTLRLLRPLLGIRPSDLRRYLVAHDVGWVEDPSNQDLHALRPRLRQGLAAGGTQQNKLIQAISAVGATRAHEETQAGAELAMRAEIRPVGFALLSSGPIGVAALGSLVRVIGGQDYQPGLSQLAELALRPRAATIAGVRLITISQGILVVREEAAIADPVALTAGAMWDNRFQVIACHGFGDSAVIGKLGDDAAHVRSCSDLPSVVLRTLPAIRVSEKLAAVPNIGYVNKNIDARVAVLFRPPGPVAGASFVPAAWA